jgi:ribosome biogenesis protein BRX1
VQVVMPLDKKKVDAANATLVEVGPRCALRPIKIFEGSFGGRVLYDNPEFVSPNVVRRLMKQQKAGKYAAKVQQRAKRKAHEEDNVLPVSEVDEVFKL